MIVVTLDLDIIVNIEARVFLGDVFVDQSPADLPFPEQHLSLALPALRHKPLTFVQPSLKQRR